MIKKISTKGYIILAAIIIIAVVGGLWLQDYIKYNSQDPLEVETEFLSYIDRGLDEESRLHYDNKIAELEASIASQGEEPGLGDLLDLGNAYNTIGELAKAKETYGQILLRSPSDAPALENLGSTLYLMQDYLGAEEAWLAAAEISGSEPHILRLVTLINDHIPEHKAQVQDILEIAITHLGQTPGLLAALGEWYFEQGDFARAISHYEVALDVDPENEILQTRLEEIRNAWKNADG
jgi:tetratricopeptide (TPR) repeat protein